MITLSNVSQGLRHPESGDSLLKPPSFGDREKQYQAWEGNLCTREEAAATLGIAAIARSELKGGDVPT